MKYILLLALVFACTTKKDQKIPPGPEVSAGESDARPVSPYTVKPCYCMKIFKPVCADGVNYGNSCEAECQGQTTWTEGHCGKTPKK
jgi:hypothetical protein